MPERFSGKFRLAAKETTRLVAKAQGSEGRGQQLLPQLEFLAGVTVRIDEPVFIGDTPEGVRIDFFALDGTVLGPRLSGRVLPRSSDHMFVRPDGIGVLRIRAIIALNDGAMLEVEEIGSVDLGADGYQRALARNLPFHSEIVVCPRILTGHPKYLWLNRLQCLGVGSTSLDQLSFHYDLFGVESRVLSPSP